ncbi:MAG: TIM barrel protein [Sulfobacillus sp.]
MTAAHETPISIGLHVPKRSGSVYLSLVDEARRTNPRPLQMFLRAPRGASRPKFADADLASAAQLISDRRLRVYVHAPYSINLCEPWNRCSQDEKDSWCLALLEDDLRLARTMGFRGVTVHTGTNGRTPAVAEAIDTMHCAVLRVIEQASEECPLLLETPAHEGNDVCWRLEDLAEFFRRFAGDRRLRITVDTAHIWASGYEPLEYLDGWEESAGPGSIGLVHFNDSKVAKGSRKDRHAIPGQGKIGTEKMSQVAKWCIDRGVDMVVE